MLSAIDGAGEIGRRPHEPRLLHRVDRGKAEPPEENAAPIIGSQPAPTAHNAMPVSVAIMNSASVFCMPSGVTTALAMTLPQSPMIP